MQKKEYEQEHLIIADYLIEKITTQQLAVGQKLPSQRQLIKVFRSNRYSVRRAIDRLVSLGWVKSVHGKGTYVKEKPTMISATFSRHSRFSDAMRRAGEQPSAHLLDWHFGEPTVIEREALALTEADKVYRLEILRFAGTSPVTVATSTLPAKLVPDMHQFLPNFRSLYGLLKERYHFTPLRKVSFIEARLPLNRDAELLEMPESIPILWIKSVNLHPDGQPAEMAVSRLRGDRQQCVVEMETLEDSASLSLLDKPGLPADQSHKEEDERCRSI